MSSALVKISAADPLAGFLADKIISQDSSVAMNIVSTGGQEKLNFQAASGSGLFHFVNAYSNGETLGDGTSRTLDALSYDQAAADAAWPLTAATFGIATELDTIDWIAWQECFLSMEENFFSQVNSQENKSYFINKRLQMPRHQLGWSAAMRSMYFSIQGNCSKWTIIDDSEPLFYRMPADQSEATGSGYQDYRFIISDMLIEGAGNGNIGIQLGATNGSLIYNVHFKNITTGLDSQFNLHLNVVYPFCTNCSSYGLRLREGQWTGATVTNAQSNAVKVFGPRIYSAASQVAGIEISAADTVAIYDPSFEGLGGGYYVLIDTQNSSTVRYAAEISNIRFELAAAATKPTAIVKLASNRCMAKISWGMCQVDPSLGSVVLIENESTGSGLANYIITEHLHVNPNGNCVFKNIKAGFQDGIFDVYNHQLVNATLSNAANWDLTGGGSVPTGANLRLLPLLP